MPRQDGHSVKRFYQAATICLLTAFLASIVVYATADLRINTSPSVPCGVYRLTHGTPRIGDIISFTPPESAVFKMALKRGYFFGQIMKRVAATSGDRVAVQESGVSVNGTLWPNSAPQTNDPKGRSLPVLRFSETLNSEMLLLMSDADRLGFDARYFGLISRHNISGVAVPVFTW
jgi:conjugative transfer signal peptidase TraF